MNLCTRPILAAAVILSASLGACAPRDDAGPPEIRLGRDECAHCGMIIDEERFSSAMILLDSGHATPVLFDDIGDMLDYEHEHADAVVKERYVHDHDSKSWRTAADCTYIWSKSLRTPMGSGFAAFADPAAARQKASGPDDRVLTFTQLASFRDQQRSGRHHD